MPLRYVNVEESRLQPRSLELADTILGRRQQRYDNSVAAREASLQEALTRGFVDQNARDEYISRTRNNFTNIANKYKGDLSAGRDDMMRAVTEARTDPYIQANKAQLEAYQLENQLTAKIGPEYAYMKSSVGDAPLYDQETGKYRTKFQPQVYDLRNLAQLAGKEAQGISARNIGKWRATGDGYQERMVGFNEQEAMNFMQGEGGEYLDAVLASQGISKDDPDYNRARSLAGESMLSGLIGKRESRADRSLDMALKAEQLRGAREANARAKAKARQTKEEKLKLSYKDKYANTGKQLVPLKYTNEMLEQFKKNPKTFSNRDSDVLKGLQEDIETTAKKQVEAKFGTGKYNELTKAEDNVKSQIKNIKDKKLKTILEENFKVGESVNLTPSEALSGKNTELLKKLSESGYVQREIKQGSQFPVYTKSEELQNFLDNYNGVIQKNNKAWDIKNQVVEDKFKPRRIDALSAKAEYQDVDKDLQSYVEGNMDAIFNNDGLKKQLINSELYDADKGKFVNGVDIDPSEASSLNDPYLTIKKGDKMVQINLKDKQEIMSGIGVLGGRPTFGTTSYDTPGLEPSKKPNGRTSLFDLAMYDAKKEDVAKYKTPQGQLKAALQNMIGASRDRDGMLNITVLDPKTKKPALRNGKPVILGRVETLNDFAIKFGNLEKTKTVKDNLERIAAKRQSAGEKREQVYRLLMQLEQ